MVGLIIGWQKHSNIRSRWLCGFFIFTFQVRVKIQWQELDNIRSLHWEGASYDIL